jgi:hypothetical protein
MKFLHFIFVTLSIAAVTARPSHESPDPKHGLPWDQKAMEDARVAMKMNTDLAYFKKKLVEYNAFCPSKPDAEMMQGAFLVMGTVMKLRTMPATKFGNCIEDNVSLDKPTSCVQTAGKVYGMLRKAALSKNGEEIAKILQQNGGSAQGLTPAMLVNVWGFNEHMNLHNVLCHPDEHKNPLPPLTSADKIFHGVHITSLSDGVGKNEYWGKKLRTDFGGFNNYGNWPERAVFESARSYPQLFTEAFN